MRILFSVLNIAEIVATAIFLFYLIRGVFIWISSSGDQDAVGRARKTIITGLAGLVTLVLIYMILSIFGRIYSNDLFDSETTIPNLDSRNTLGP